jgi:hypothetical protein
MPFLEPPLRVASAHLSLLGLEQPTRLFPGRQALRLPLWTFGKHGLAEHWRGSLIARTDSRPEPGSAPPEALRLVPTTGDGRCLFRAIVAALAVPLEQPLASPPRTGQPSPETFAYVLLTVQGNNVKPPSFAY